MTAKEHDYNTKGGRDSWPTDTTRQEDLVDAVEDLMAACVEVGHRGGYTDNEENVAESVEKVKLRKTTLLDLIERRETKLLASLLDSCRVVRGVENVDEKFDAIPKATLIALLNKLSKRRKK